MFEKNETGSVAVLALILVVVLSILLGSLFIVPAALSGSNRNRDNIQAQYAAEAGVKRVIAACYGQLTAWNWVKNSQIQALVDDDISTYQVSINKKSSSTVPDWVNYNQAPDSGNYIITSIGRTKNSSVTIQCEIAIAKRRPVSFPNASLYAQGNITAGSGVEFWVHNTDGNAPEVICGAGTVPSQVKANRKVTNNTTTIDTVAVEAYNTETALPALVSNENRLTDTMYYYDGDLEINTDNVTLTGSPTIIFITGDLTINKKMNVDKVMFVVNGDVTIGGQANNTNFTGSVIYTNGNMTISGGIDLNGGSNLIVQGNLNFNAGVTNYNGNSATNIQFQTIINNDAADSDNSVSVSVVNWSK